VVVDAAALDELRPAWLELLGRSDASTAMLTPMWLATWWRIWGAREGRQLRIVLFHQGERLAGLAPLLRRRHWHRGLVPLWRLEPLGSGEPPGERVCTDYLNVIAERGAETLVANSLADAVATGRLGSWDELVLPSMDGSGVMPELLRAAFARQGARVAIEAVDTCTYAALPAAWDEYLQAQSSSRRYLINRSIRDLEKWAGPDLRHHAANSPDELAEGTRLLHALHGERWRADGQDGVFAAGRFSEFHDRAMPELLAAGALDLEWLSVAGRPIAVQYNLAWNGKVVTYQSGRAMDLPGKIRAGLVLHAHAMRRAIEAGRREYDFLAGASRYKTELGNAARPLVDFRAVRPSLAVAGQRAAEAGVNWARAVRDRLRRSARAAPGGTPTAATAEGWT
jgi:CelD/BcsL family acetyltransferase involved in cellulose biosynthesis